MEILGYKKSLVSIILNPHLMNNYYEFIYFNHQHVVHHPA